jgi:hypothetical protein
MAADNDINGKAGAPEEMTCSPWSRRTERGVIRGGAVGKRSLVVLSAAAVVLSVALPAGTASPAQSTTTTANPATDRTTAQEINLTGTDLPGWKESPNPTDTKDPGLESKLAACVGRKDPGKGHVVEVPSPNFDKGSIEISSSVTMVASHADGLANLRTLKNPRLPNCAKKLLTSTLASQLPKGTTVSKVKVSTFAPPEAVPNSFALRASITITGKTQGITVSVPVTVTEIGFLVGRAEVTLNEDQKGKLSPIAEEPGLIQTLSARAGGTVSA